MVQFELYFSSTVKCRKEISRRENQFDTEIEKASQRWKVFRIHYCEAFSVIRGHAALPRLHLRTQIEAISS